MTEDARPVEDRVRWELDGAIGRITIDAPEQGNALAWDMRDRMTDLFTRASADLHVRAVVLSATGERHFCTGAHLGGPRPAAPDRPDGAPDLAVGDASRLIRRGWQRLVASVLDCEKPVVGAINGTAAGGGAQLAIACDFVVMAEHARLIEVFVRRGIMPDAGGAYLLPRIVGLHKAKELLMLGDDVPALEAQRLGIAMQVVPDHALHGTASALAARLAGGPTTALAMTKRLLNRSFESDRAAAFEQEAHAQELVNQSDDAQEGILAFIERRDPRFRGW